MSEAESAAFISSELPDTLLRPPLLLGILVNCSDVREKRPPAARTKLDGQLDMGTAHGQQWSNRPTDPCLDQSGTRGRVTFC